MALKCHRRLSYAPLYWIRSERRDWDLANGALTQIMSKPNPSTVTIATCIKSVGLQWALK